LNIVTSLTGSSIRAFGCTPLQTSYAGYMDHKLFEIFVKKHVYCITSSWIHL